MSHERMGLYWSLGTEELARYGELDLEELRGRVSHPVLAAVLTALGPRSRDPEEVVAYYDDGPTGEPGPKPDSGADRRFPDRFP